MALTCTVWPMDNTESTPGDALARRLELVVAEHAEGRDARPQADDRLSDVTADPEAPTAVDDRPPDHERG